jgi:hypothetical protein
VQVNRLRVSQPYRLQPLLVKTIQIIPVQLVGPHFVHLVSKGQHHVQLERTQIRLTLIETITTASIIFATNAMSAQQRLDSGKTSKDTSIPSIESASDRFKCSVALIRVAQHQKRSSTEKTTSRGILVVVGRLLKPVVQLDDISQLAI